MKLDLEKNNVQTKKEIIASAAKESQFLIDEGFADIPQVLVNSKKIIEYVTSFAKGLESHVRGEVDKCGKDGLTSNGAKLSLGSTGTRLSYEDDSVYAELKAKLKAREAILKTVYDTKTSIADADKGEMIPIVSVKSASRETLMVKY